jgi:hypothetical protein
MIPTIDLLLNFCDLPNFTHARIIKKMLYKTSNLQKCET